ncbi:MAG: Ig-like domain-containing protein [Treponema sp.]|jgi:hypothetical protein|nr:Ig-like domain-containing protein [Treponema sp.]
MKIKLYILLLFLLSFISCDVLRFSRFEVISWAPGGGYRSEPEKITVSLDFSQDPDMSSVERNFSLTGNGNRIRGTFFWNGKRMTFVPLTPLEKNTDYIISLSADACNTKGLSMDEAFNGDFTTRPDNARPVLISCYPEMFAEIDEPRTEVHLSFSTPVPLNTLYDNVSFSPSMTGSWRLEDGGKLAVFTPAEPWKQNNRYEIRYSTSLTDNNGMNIGNDFISIFTVGTDHEVPYLLYAGRITKNGDIVELIPDKGYTGAAELPVENHGWEKDDRLYLVFSKPVDGLLLKNYIIAEGAPSLVRETSPDFNTEHIFTFNNIPAYESRFTFRIKPGITDKSGNESWNEYIYRIFANGKFSKPPSLVGLRMPMTLTLNSADIEFFYAGTDSIFDIIPIKNNYYPSGESIQTWIELYFNTAEGALVDTFSLMELFHIETSNNVITFSPRHIKCSDFSVSKPHQGWENYERLEIAGNIVNSTNNGVIYFQISSGLRDSLGNKNEKPLVISVIK